MSTKALFPSGGGPNFNFRNRYRKPNNYSKNSTCYQVFSSNFFKMTLNIFSKNSSCYQVFHQILKNCNFGVKKKSLPTQMDLHDPYIVPWGIIIFLGVLTNSTFRQNFHIWKKIVDLMKDLKYEHQSIFPMWGRVKINFRDRYGKPNIYSKNSSHYQFFSSNSE